MVKYPNILLFFPDQHRGDWTELNSSVPVKTPNLRQMAENGTTFSQAITPSPLCSPARSCLASGREYDHCKIINNSQSHPLDEISFYSLLRDVGYHVLGCGKFDLAKPQFSYGKDGKQRINGESLLHKWGFSDGIDNGGKHNGFRAYTQKHKWCPYIYYLSQKGQLDVFLNDFKKRTYKTVTPTLLADEDYADNWIARNGLKLIQETPPGKPWFLQVNFNGPHEPMDVTKSMRDRWQSVTFPQPFECKRFTDEESQGIRQNYAAMIENIDRWLGIYKDEIAKRGELENTLIVYCSDHGEMLGDHDLIGKSVPHHPSVRVPLFFTGLDVKKKQIISRPTSTIDLAATFLDYAQIQTPSYMDSQSLRSLVNGTGSEKDATNIVSSGLNRWRMVFDGRYKYVTGYTWSKTISKTLRAKIRKIFTPRSPKKMQTEPQALFDLIADPQETKNIIDDHLDIASELRQRFLTAKKSAD